MRLVKIRVELFSIQVPEFYLLTQAERMSKQQSACPGVCKLWAPWNPGDSGGLTEAATGCGQVSQPSRYLCVYRLCLRLRGFSSIEFIVVVYVRFLCKKGITHLCQNVKNLHLALPTTSYDRKRSEAEGEEGARAAIFNLLPLTARRN